MFDPENNLFVFSNVVRLQMMKFAWDNYVKYAWGENELRPESKAGFSGASPVGGSNLGLTIIDSLDTLFIMGLTEEFEAGTRWIWDNFDFASAVFMKLQSCQENLRDISRTT